MAAIAPRALAFIKEADVIAPGRRRSSDGTYANKPGDHNVGTRGLVHAADLSLSMPNTPFWEPRFQQFDVHAWQREIAAQYVAATPAVREKRWPWLFDGGYMHGYSAVRKVDVIFGPTVSLTWRVDNNPPGEHIQHGHFSIGHSVRSEQDTQPIFGPAEVEDDVTPEDRAAIKSDTNAVVRERLKDFEDRLPDLVEAAINKKFGGYSPSGSYVDGLLITAWRKQLGLSKP